MVGIFNNCGVFIMVLEKIEKPMKNLLRIVLKKSFSWQGSNLKQGRQALPIGYFMMNI